MARGTKVKRPTVIQFVFYALVFLTGFIYQPNWVYENFWSKADFYSSIPFDFPYFGYILIYCCISTTYIWLLVKFAKKYL
jgi:hypothetical protein